MEKVKKAEQHLIFKKRSGRYAVKDAKTKTWVNGDAKTEILIAQGLVTRAAPRPAEPQTDSRPEAEEPTPAAGADEPAD